MASIEADRPADAQVAVAACQAGRPLRSAELLVEESLCVNLRARREDCRACAKVCHAAAIHPGLDTVDLDEAACTTCGACLPACPSGALRLSSFHPQRFVEAAAGQARVHLHCRRSLDGGGGIVVPCLAAIDARLLAALAAGGTRGICVHGLDQCAGCDLGQADGWLETVEGALAGWLEADALRLHAAGAAERAEGGRERQDQAQVSRRGFLKFAGLRAAETVQRWALPVAREEDQADERRFFQLGATPQRPAAYQQTLREARERVPWREDAALPWMDRAMRTTCSACGACGERCPTGALQTLDGAGSRTISFEAGLCTGCDVCLNVCPTDAIEAWPLLAPWQPTEERVVRVDRPVLPCSQCRQPVLAETLADGLCAVCHNEQDLDDEWLAMLQG